MADQAQDHDIDPALLEERKRRWEAYERGEIKSYSWEEVRAQLFQCSDRPAKC
jgi:hypothetical protein